MPVRVIVTAALAPLVPVSAIVIGDVPPPVKLSVSVADSLVPGAAVGVNVTTMTPDDPFTSVPPENDGHAGLPVPTAKSRGLAPLSVRL